MNLEEKTTLNCKNILINNYKININNKVIIIYDTKSILSPILKTGFEKAINELKNKKILINFFSKEQDEILEIIKTNLKKEDIIVLIQSTSFRVSKYRWRNELCDQGFKVVEFSQLIKMNTEVTAFIESLTDDFEHYKTISNKLISLLNKSNEVKIISTNNSEIIYSKLMDKCIRNIGSLWEQTNWTTRYPIGEVITESLDLSTLNGEFLGYAYPSLNSQLTTFTKPFKCVVKNGLLISHEGDEKFNEIYNLLKTENENKRVFIREFGLGLNRHIKKNTQLSDPLSYERVEGMHFSLGMKHGMYQKKLWKEWGKKFYQRYHIDLYVDIKEMYIDNVLVYTQNKGYF